MTGVNYATPLKQYEAALAAYHAAVADLHGKHVERLACGQAGLVAETNAALGSSNVFENLDHTNLNGLRVLLQAQVRDVTCEEIEAAAKDIDAKLAKVAAAEATLKAARQKLDAVIAGASTSAKETVRLLNELCAAKKKK